MQRRPDFHNPRPSKTPTSDLIFGWHAVMTALQEAPHSVKEVWLGRGRPDKRSQELEALVQRLGIHLKSADMNELNRMAGGDARHQGVLASVAPIKTLDDHGLDRFMTDRPTLPSLILALDQIQDPHNLGACLRSAAAAGVELVVIPEHQSAGITPTVRKVAAGGADKMPIAVVTNLVRALRRLQEFGMQLVGGDGEASASIHDVDLTGPTIIVTGSEEDGLRRLTREACDHLVSIPMPGRMESLNVSVATGIMLFEAVRQKQRLGPTTPMPRPARE